MTKNEPAEKEGCDVTSRGGRQCSRFGIPCKVVHGDDDPTLTGGCAWEWAVEIDTYAVERARRTRQGLKGGTCVLWRRLAPLAVRQDRTNLVTNLYIPRQ